MPHSVNPNNHPPAASIAYTYEDISTSGMLSERELIDDVAAPPHYHKKVIFFDLHVHVDHEENDPGSALRAALLATPDRPLGIRGEASLINKACRIYRHALRQYKRKGKPSLTKQCASPVRSGHWPICRSPRMNSPSPGSIRIASSGKNQERHQTCSRRASLPEAALSAGRDHHGARAPA